MGWWISSSTVLHFYTAISCPINFMEKSLKRHPPFDIEGRMSFLETGYFAGFNVKEPKLIEVEKYPHVRFIPASL